MESATNRKTNALLAVFVAIALGMGLAALAFVGVPRAQAASDNLVAAQASKDDSVSTQATTAYLTAAKSKYGVTDDRVITVNASAGIQAFLDDAALAATASKKWIVYLPEGNYGLSGSITVPQNVVLVGEAASKVSPNESFDILVNIRGSVYGGTFDSKKLNLTTLKFLECNFADNNGRIDKSVVTNSNRYGIVAIHGGCRNVVVSGVKVTGSYWSGISILDAAYAKLIENSDFSKNGTVVNGKGEGAGINLSHADVGVIRNCTMNNNADKAVSTNSDPVSGYKQPGCTIKSITGCVMKGNKVNGVYIKPKCKLLSFTNNTLIGNNDGLSAIAITPAGTKGASVIKKVSGNTFKTSKNMQIKSVGKGAVIYIGNNNTIVSGKKAGIEAREKGKVVITGSNNKISKNKGAGFNVRDGGVLTFKGKKNVVSKNGHSAIYCVNKAKATIANATLKGRIYCTDKATVVLKKVKLTGAVAVGSGGKVTGK